MPLVKDVEGAQQAYNAAMQRLNQTSLEGQSNLSSVSILDTAKIPDKPDSPKILLNMILSVFLGSALALGVGLLAEILDRRVRSAEDLVDILQTTGTIAIRLVTFATMNQYKLIKLGRRK